MDLVPWTGEYRFPGENRSPAPSSSSFPGDAPENSAAAELEADPPPPHAPGSAMPHVSAQYSCPMTRPGIAYCSSSHRTFCRTQSQSLESSDPYR